MLRNKLFPYQKNIINFIKRKRKCALFIGLGYGKTIITLTAISDFIQASFIKKVLIIAPLNVANTVWKQEAVKWEHTKFLKISICTGSAKKRLKAFKENADIYVINKDAVPWLINLGWYWDMLVIDESTTFKSHSSKRFKAIKDVKCKSVVLLSGTPSPNGLMDLWSQIYLIDSGRRLGENITSFRHKYFHQVFTHLYEPKDNARYEISNKIKDICIVGEDIQVEKIPHEYIYQTVEVPLNVTKSYKKLEREFLIKIAETDIFAPTSAVLANKLLQMCNGAVYDEEKRIIEVHNAKIEALKDLISYNEGENILIAYNFKSDLLRLKEALPNAKVLNKDVVEEWNKGEVPLMLAHPASCGHGLNIQYGGSLIVWFGLNWSLELYQQFNGRLVRKGQKNFVRIYHILMAGGIDFKIRNVLRLKNINQSEFLKAVG